MCFHKWSKWEKYQDVMLRVRNGKEYKYIVDRQKRNCIKCNKEQSEKIYEN